MIDVNDIGPLVQKCSNVDFLHHLAGMVKDRVKELGGPAEPVCRTCGGAKQVRKKVKGRHEWEAIPCPKCAATVTPPSSAFVLLAIEEDAEQPEYAI